MKLNEVEKLCEIGKFNKPLSEVSVKGLVSAFEKHEIEYSEDNFQVRDYLLDIEFNPKGFEALYMELYDKNLIPTVLNHPVFLVRFKDGKVHNLFTDIGRLNMYGFKSNMKVEELNDYKLCIALDHYLEDPIVRGVEMKRNLIEGDDKDHQDELDLISQIVEICVKNDIFIGKRGTPSDLAFKVKQGKLTLEDIAKNNF